MVFLFDAAFALDDDGLLAAAFVALDLDGAGDFGHDGGILGFPGFEDFGDARKTGGDIRRALGFLRLTSEQVTGFHDLAGVDVDTSLGGQEVEVQNLAVDGIDDLDLGVTFALVFDDNEALAAFLAFGLGADGFTFLDVLEFDATALFREDRDAVRIPDGDLLPALDGVFFLHEQRGTIRHLLAFEFAALGIHQGDEAVALQYDRVAIAFVIGDIDGVQIAVFDDTGRTGADVVLGRGDVAEPPVWKVRMVSWVPGSPMDWAAMMPVARPSSTSLPVERSTP